MQNQNINELYYYENAFPLAVLFQASEKIDDLCFKRLGIQRLPLIHVNTGEKITITSDADFNGVLTRFAVKKNNRTASENDYTLSENNIVFLTKGSYEIEMMNDAIFSSERYEAKVLIPYEVTEENLTGTDIKNGLTSEIKIFPNPAESQITVVKKTEPLGCVEIYSLTGAKVYSGNFENQFSGNISVNHFAKGIYMVRTGASTVKFVKQ